MSLDRCLAIIEQRYDREQDLEAVFEELAELESETLAESDPEDYHRPLESFLVRIDELFNEEEFNEGLAMAAVSNLRSDLERMKSNRVPDDPLEHLFKDMLRYEAGTVQSSTTLATLSRYETLLLALRDQFERSTDPTDSSEVAVMMRQGLETLEDAGRRLRLDLENEIDYNFEEIREQFNAGTNILMEFRKKAVFVDRSGEQV